MPFKSVSSSFFLPSSSPNISQTIVSVIDRLQQYVCISSNPNNQEEKKFLTLYKDIYEQTQVASQTIADNGNVSQLQHYYLALRIFSLHSRPTQNEHTFIGLAQSFHNMASRVPGFRSLTIEQIQASLLESKSDDPVTRSVKQLIALENDAQYIPTPSNSSF